MMKRRGYNLLKRQKNQSIKEQIFSGYFVVIIITVILLIASVIYLAYISKSYRVVSENWQQQGQTQIAVSQHYQWLEMLNESISTGKSFEGSLDPTACNFGKWLSSMDTSKIENATIKQALIAIEAPHQQIHTKAKDVLELSKTDRAAAYEMYLNEIKPNTQETIQYLTTVSNTYESIANQADATLHFEIRMALITSVLLSIIGIVSAVFFANSSSKRISKPIADITVLAQRMALGIYDDKIDIDNKMLEKEIVQNGKGNNEIITLLKSFCQMAEHIKENVRVVERVAQGDMTVFVNIQSSEDQLGKSLYKLVQSNDFTYANILKVASGVASSAEQIANAGHMLAENATKQASDVHELSDTIEAANELVRKNVEKTHQANAISNEIRNKVYESTEKMKTLKESVEEIKEASEKISSVIKSIEDIAFQTNILSLNASVEAARAGEAGKGFAVVANEVRVLALRSADAAKNSKALIENTMQKTALGVEVSNDAFSKFSDIVNHIDDILKVIVDISNSSDMQNEYMTHIHEEISEINRVVSNNAAASEEFSAESQSMKRDAAILKEEMHQFNLRKREPGKPYIPPEKKNDAEFIKEASENYRHFMESHEK